MSGRVATRETATVITSNLMSRFSLLHLCDCGVCSKAYVAYYEGNYEGWSKQMYKMRKSKHKGWELIEAILTSVIDVEVREDEGFEGNFVRLLPKIGSPKTTAGLIMDVWHKEGGLTLK